jgi:CheY-like chemotaxis protein
VVEGDAGEPLPDSRRGKVVRNCLILRALKLINLSTCLALYCPGMAEPQKTSLLVVDDDKNIRRLLARIAEREGFEVFTARDGVEALEMFAQRGFDIAIVDLMMPRLSGYELVQKISALNPRPIVIVATALTNGDVASLDDSMVRRVIRKPFDVTAVAEALVETARQMVAEPRTEPEVVKFDAAEVVNAPVKKPDAEPS